MRTKFIYQTLIFLFLVYCSCVVQAQDTLFFKSGEVKEIQLLEIGIDEVKFKVKSENNDIIHVIDKSLITAIHLANHEKIKFLDDPYDGKFSDKDILKTNAIKFNFFSPLLKYIAFSYEKSIQPWKNIEIEMGALGVGISENNDNISGAMVSIGLKLIKKPDYKLRNQKMSHILHGKYFKPEIIFNSYKRNLNHSSFIYPQYLEIHERASYTNFALNMVFGKQNFFKGGIVVDTYIGLGYGLQLVNGKFLTGEKEDYYHDSNAISHMQGDSSFPVTFSFGLKIGGAF